ncbi:MAG TPA: phosphoenolpyruvate--protein phosphotransferase [Terriglobales bacterium]|nr:phosphoenolpyruvate--protein phosphotransferase [Terriglobales bacterium]
MLLKRLRNVMARGGTAEQRLNQIVKLIAADMVAEVCSTYVMRAGEVLELFATEGLKQDAVHKTRLRVGEGLVGDIASHARPLALADAQHHPQFAYRPETGEEIFQSLMGVPILRNGRVLGVLVIQNKSRRQYSDEEVEVLETIAMVVAELVASGELVNTEELRPGDGNALLPVRIEGLVLSPGLAIGTAVLHAPELRLQQLVAEDTDIETDRLNQAVFAMRLAIDEMLASSDLAGGGEHREVLESYRMFAEDKGWVNRMTEAIGTGLTAEAAVQKVQNDMRARMRDISDPYLRERLSDLDDLANRLLKHLIGGDAMQLARELPDDAILIARNMGPAELLDYNRAKLRGLALEEGAAASHVAIVARALDIPVLGRCAGLLAKVSEGDPLALEGDHGQLFVRPPEDIQQVFATSLLARAKRQEAYAAVKDLPAVTLDGVGITLSMNAGLLIDVPQLAATGAAGIGLYRTEIPFMVAHEFPDTKRQADIYRKALDSAGGKPIVFRTLDIGSDKVLPYWQRAEEENPAMGWRAIRIALDRPALLRQQLRALIIAADGRDLRVMFPMVTEVAEFDRCRSLLDLELQRTKDRGLTLPAQLQVGAMVEVPALLWQLDELLKRVDFVSVGSNDLKQFVYAADRATPSVNDRYDILSPAMVRLLGAIAVATKQSGKALSLCGEMAGDPIGAMALLCLGYRNLSMTPPSIGPLRMMIRSLHLRQLQDYWATLNGLPGSAVRSALVAFAQDHAIQL